MPTRVALAYSGGLDTSAIIPWLIEQYDCEVIAVAGDVGQGAEELLGIEAKARGSGARDCYVVDLKKQFIEDFAFPTLISGGFYEGRYLLGTAIARPLLAKAQVDIARNVGADALAHGCTGKGNDQVRFESTFAALAPDLEVIAPWRQWSMRSRTDLLLYLDARGIATSASAEKIYSRDANLWHVSHEGGELENPWNPPPDDIWLATIDPLRAPDQPELVAIGFEAGRPRALNGEPLDGPTLVHRLNAIAGAHGVGRVDLVENRLVGMKSRGCYESPGATVLAEALRSLAELVLDRPTMRYREQLGGQFAELVYNGQWFTPLCQTLLASIESIGQSLTGEVVVRLCKGSAQAVQRRSPNSLYDQSFATFDEDEVYNQAHAEGFIRLFSLPSRIAAMRAAEAGVL